MATAIDVMKYIKSQRNVYGEMQLQKLVYYAQAWSLAWDGRPLFNERVEAWRMGPVLPALRYREDGPDATVLTEAERATVDAVLSHYGAMSGGDLGRLTHEEAPWKDVWGDRKPHEKCRDEISHDAMRRFYTREALAGKGPHRGATSTGRADRTELREIVAANAVRWREALELLSR